MRGRLLLAGKQAERLDLRSLLDVAFVLVMDEAGGPAQRSRVHDEIQQQGVQMLLGHPMFKHIGRRLWGVTPNALASAQAINQLAEGLA